MDRLYINTGVRLTAVQMAKLDQIATALGTSRNRAFGLLIDSAEVQSTPAVSVGMQKNTRQAASTLTETSSLTGERV